VGTDAAVVGPGDHLVVRETATTRWHRCLRCDGWIPVPAPAAPSRERVPGRQEIELPLRGPELRDRYVLRLIALDRAVHVVVLVALAVAVFFFLGHRTALRHDYVAVMNALTGTTNGHDLLGRLRSLFVINPGDLRLIGLALVGYAALEATEMVGLWFTRRWAEYLTFLATIVFVPIEVDELAKSVSALKLATLAVNLAIAAYLLVAKRLFGLRGGYRAERERRRALGGWEAVERATPPAPG